MAARSKQTGETTGNSSRPKRQPGFPSAFANRRGGPANIAGIGFQVDYTLMRILAWLLEHWGDPTGTGVIRCEPRILHPDPTPEMSVGQHGFDVAMTGRAHHPPDYRELKRSPVADEVVELLASLRQVPDPGTDEGLVIGMVAQSATAPFKQLCDLYDVGRESADDAELVERVAGYDKKDMTAFLAALGERPWATLQRMAQPEQWAETVLSEHIRLTAHALAGDAEGGRRLTDRLQTVVRTASERREAIQLGGLAAELVDTGLLHAKPTSMTPEDGDLAAVFVVLEVCATPLPKTLLAQAMGLTVTDLEAMLAEAVATGHVLEDGGDALFRVAHPENPLATQYGQPLLGEVLNAIYAWAGDVKVGAAGQTLNAFALAELCLDSRTDVVADLFRIFDKASKRWGDLDIIWKLAQLSDRALLQVMGEPLSDEKRAQWAKVRAQTYICGQGWVLQRVGELDEAIRFMERAKEISQSYHDDENHAFTLKCQGRLHRMLAELLLGDDPDRMAHLDTSVELLTGAEDAFAALVPVNRRFVSDRGESISLLARTLASFPDFDQAVETAQTAEAVLAGKEDEKAYADLKILQAELFYQRVAPDAEDYEDMWSQHHGTLSGLVETHDSDGRHGPGSGGDRGASEVVARLHLTIALLEERTDVASARSHYQQAAQIYRRLNYRPGFEDALWHDRLMSGEAIPDGLREALEAAGAAPGVALLALNRAERLSTGGGAAATIESASPIDNLSAEEWRSLVSDAAAEHTATRPRWADGRSSA